MPSKVDILSVPRVQLAAMWTHAALYLTLGLTVARDVALEELVDDLVHGSARLWVALDGARMLGAFITSIYDEDDRSFLGVYALGGTQLTRWAGDLSEAMEREAKAHGCSSVRFCGREAWSRILPAYRIAGHRDGHAIFERAVI